MKIIQVQLNCTNEKEYYKMLGHLMVAQKLLNDYMSHKEEEGVGPEGFAEEWMKEFGLDNLSKDYVLSFFNCSLLVIGKSKNVFRG